MFGYFPTYLLGAMYATQIYQHAATQIPDLEAKIEAGDFKPLRVRSDAPSACAFSGCAHASGVSVAHGCAHVWLCLAMLTCLQRSPVPARIPTPAARHLC